MMTHKHRAIQFLQSVVDGKIDEAYELYVDMNGKHHNMFFSGDFSSLMRGMKENHEKFPYKKLTVKHALEDGAFVAVHSHLVFHEEETGMIVIHLFRFENNKIVELWDCGQAIPSESTNKEGAF